MAVAITLPVSAWTDERPRPYPSNDPRITELRQTVDRASQESERIQRELAGEWVYHHEIGKANVGFRWKKLTINRNGTVVVEYQASGADRGEVLKGSYEFLHRGTPQKHPGKRPVVLFTVDRPESGLVLPLVDVTVDYDARVPVSKGMVLKFRDLENNEFVFLKSQ